MSGALDRLRERIHAAYQRERRELMANEKRYLEVPIEITKQEIVAQRAFCKGLMRALDLLEAEAGSAGLLIGEDRPA